MIAPKQSPQMAHAFVRQKERLLMPFTAWPAYVLLPVGLVMVLTLYVSLELSGRLLSPSKPITLSGPETDRSGLWLAVAPDQDTVIITTTQGQTFTLDQGSTSNKDLITYLKGQSNDILQSAVLANHMDENTTLVVLSADERLTYNHIRPVLYALASAGFTRYAFEGRIVKE